MKKIFIVTILTALIGGGAFLYISKPTNSIVATYDNLSDVLNSANFYIRVPRIIADEDNLSYSNISGQLISIHNENIEFKAGVIDNDNIDIGGYYGEYNIDKRYKASGTIENVRIRTNSDSIDNMTDTIISYKCNNTSYSLKIHQEITLEDIIEILDIQGLEEIENQEYEIQHEEVSRSTVEETDKYTTYKIQSLKAKIELPNTVVKPQIIEGYRDDICYCTFMLGSKPIMILETKNNEETNVSINTIQIDKGYTLRYYKENVFEDGTDEYSSYDDILNSLDYIIRSIEVIVEE